MSTEEEGPGIIKPGIPKPKAPVKEDPLPSIVCTSCGCEFTYRKSDPYSCFIDNHLCQAIKCPQDGCDVWVTIAVLD